MSLFVFPGSFDPFTRGHLDLATRALSICDRLVVAVAVNPGKRALFLPDERVELIRRSLGEELEPRTEVMAWNGLVADLVATTGADAVVRGIRGAADLDWELSLHEANRALAPGFETVLLPCSPELRWISSSLIRELLDHGRDVSALVPDAVAGDVNARGKKR